MIKYTTSEIFKRAKQIADIEGSSFISWNESIALINEAWTSFYQKLIDKGDQSFMKEQKVTTGSYKLPSDWWQLKGVFTQFNGILKTVERRPENGDYNTICYEIKNNVLHIYGSAETVLVQYWTAPKTLTYKPSEIAIGLAAGTYLGCCDNFYLLRTDDSLSVIDITGKYTQEDIMTVDDTFSKAWITKDYVFWLGTDKVYHLYELASGNTCDWTMGNDEFYAPIFTESGSLFWMKEESDLETIYLAEIGEEINLIKVKTYGTVDLLYSDEFYSDDDLTDFFGLNSDGKVYHNGIDIGDFSAEKLIYHNGECYYLRPLCFGKISSDDEIYIIKNSPGAYIGFNHIDERTGFGYTSKLYGSYYVCPYCEDTELNYPNSFFFSILEYMVALAIKAKQGADGSPIQTQLSIAESTFFDSLGSDAYQSTRITNCY